MTTLRIALLQTCLAESGGAIAQDARDGCAPGDIGNEWMITLTRGDERGQDRT